MIVARRTYARAIFVGLIFVSAALPAQHVTYVESVWDDLLEDASVIGGAERPYINVRTLATTRWTFEENPDLPYDGFLPSSRPLASSGSVALYALPGVAWMSYNSAYPSGGNDGAAWQGRGVNASSTAGVRVEAPYVSATLAPTFWTAQNLGFDLVPSATSSEFGYFTSNIDLYQRPGDDPLAEFAWGESEIRVGGKVVSIGFGTTSVRLGPAQANPIMLSENAAGFPRLDLLLRPTETRIGTFETLAFWGRLDESEYFDDDADNDHRLITAFSFSYRPSFVAGLTLGFHRTVIANWEDAGAAEAFTIFIPEMDTSLGRDELDQRGSITIDWRFPTVGFNIYGEWARNDYSSNWRNIVRAPGHSQAFTIGGRQAIRGSFPGFFLVSGELTQLILSRDYYIDLGVGQSGFYTHGTVRQGYTHRGQSIGAAIGTGANAQMAEIEYVFYRGTAGLFVERVARDQDYIYGDPDAAPKDIRMVDVEMRYGSRGVFFVSSNVALDGELSIANTINRNYEEDNDVINFYGRFGVTVSY